VAARKLGVALQPLQVRRPEDFEAAFAAAEQGKAHSSPSMTASPVCTDPGSWPWLPTAQRYAADPRPPTSVPPQRSCTDTAIIIKPQGCNIRSWGFLIWRRRLKRIATRLGTVVRQMSNAHRIALSELASMRRAFLVGPIVTTALRPDPWAPN